MGGGGYQQPFPADPICQPLSSMNKEVKEKMLSIEQNHKVCNDQVSKEFESDTIHGECAEDLVKMNPARGQNSHEEFQDMFEELPGQGRMMGLGRGTHFQTNGMLSSTFFSRALGGG